MNYTIYIDDVIATASGENGYLEKRTNAYLDEPTKNAGSNNYTKYARDLDKMNFYNTPKQGYAWCDVFVDWCFVKTFGADLAKKALYQPDKSLGASCTYSAQYYKKAGAWHNVPKRGDQVFFKDKTGNMAHTGLVDRVTDEYIYTIEGNTSSASGVVANGGGVFGKAYKRSYDKIAGYGRPNWAAVAAAVPEDAMKIEDIVKQLTPEMCNAIVDMAQAYSKDLPAPEWAQKELAEAQAAGITDGTTPMRLIPRYQAALMAYRAYKMAIETVIKALKEA